MKTVAAEPRATYEDSSRRTGWTIIAVKLRAFRNRLAVKRRKSPAMVGLHFGFAVPAILGFTALLTIGFASAVSSLNDVAEARALLAVIIAFGCIGAFIGSSTTALQAMFLADDIPFLLTLPIPLRALFGSKYIEATLGVAPAGMLIIAGALGYGFVESDRVLYWPLALLLLFAFLSIATSTSVIVVSLVTRYIPPRRARLFLLCISLAIMTLILVGWRALAPRPEKLGNVVNQNQYESIWNALEWTPVGAGAMALQEAAHGRLVLPVIATTGLLALSGVLIAVAFQVFRGTFFRGLAQTQAVQTAVPNESITSWLSRIAGLLPHRIGALVLKEWLVLFRDLRRLSGAIWPVGVVLIYSVMLGRSNNATFGSSEFEFWSKNGSLALMPWGLSLGISVYSYGSEGRNVHLMCTLPFSAFSIFLAKAIASILPIGLVSVSAAAASLWIRQAPLVPSIQLLMLMIWMVAGYALIDTSASALAPNFETDQVQRTIGLSGRLFSFVAGGLFSLATLVGAGRLILYSHPEPDSLVDILNVKIGVIEPMGWPLVLLAIAAAAAVVAISAKSAVHRTGMLLSEAG